MKKYIRYQYFVEGETEKKLIEEFKRAGNLILPGSVNTLNVKQKLLTSARLANLAENTVVILVFDTDTDGLAVLRKNIQTLIKSRNVLDVWCVTQVKNLEDELLRSTDVHEIKELIGCRSNSDFKRDWLREKHLLEKLKRHSFRISVFWSSQPQGEYADIENCGYRVKLTDVVL